MKSFNTRIPCDIQQVGQVVGYILHNLDDRYGKLDECVSFELRLILNELVLNAIKHGNKCDIGKSVKISVGMLKDHHVVLAVEDEGEGYDYSTVYSCTGVTDCILDEDDIFSMKETGRGMLLVKNLCDRIKFNKKGNRVIILKKVCK